MRLKHEKENESASLAFPTLQRDFPFHNMLIKLQYITVVIVS